MRSARRIVSNVSTAVKQRRGIGLPQWSMASVTAMVKPWSTNKNRDLSTSVMRWRGSPQWPATNIRFFENRFIRHDLCEVGYTVDVADLLFSPERDFLLRNNGQKVKVDDLQGKTIVLFIVPLDAYYVSGSGEYLRRPGEGDTWDMIDAYHELLRVGIDYEFVFVPVRIDHHRAGYVDERHEGFFHDIFSSLPFPAIPFSDAQPRESPVVQTFALDDPYLSYDDLPYWVVIDPANTVVATRYSNTSSLFKLFGGADLHPFSQERICKLDISHGTVQQISKWDQLLASNTRDFLLSSNGDKVPISSLKGKLVGLYFCENIPHPPRMQAIKKVYEEAKSRGYDFEIVQITFHYHPFNARYRETNPTVKQYCEDVSWLTLPFKDPSCRKLQRILHCAKRDDYDNYTEYWVGDSLVLIYPYQCEAEVGNSSGVRQLSVAKIPKHWGYESSQFARRSLYDVDHSSKVHYELLGAEILEIWGIEGYPFKRKSLYGLEYEIQKREVKVQSLFPPGEYLLRSVGDGFDLVDAVSQLSGKRVLVLFANHYGSHSDCGGNFVSMLKSEYEAQEENNVEEESKFEVVYVSTGDDISSFDEFTKDMPWLVRPFSELGECTFLPKFIKENASDACAVAFNEQGELIAKANPLPETEEGEKLQFPFIDQDLEKCINFEVDAMCRVSNYVANYS